MPEIQTRYTLAPEEEEQLKKILGRNFQARLSQIAEAAFAEYLEMILGQKVFTRASDLFEYRLLLLIKSGVFDGEMPDESMIGNLFQMTDSRAGALLRATASKHRFEMEATIEKSLISILKKAKPENGSWIIKTTSSNKDRLNAVLTKMDGKVTGIKSHSDLVSTYLITKSACEKLCAKYNLEIKGEKIVEKAKG